MSKEDPIELARRVLIGRLCDSDCGHLDRSDCARQRRDTLARAVLELAAERDAAREGEDTWFRVGEKLACESIEITAERDRLRAALGELAVWAMLKVQTTSQGSDYQDDPEWKRADDLRRLAEGT